MKDDKKTYYTIVTDKPLKGVISNNIITVRGTTVKETLEVILYNSSLIRETLKRIEEHELETITFNLVDLKKHDIVFTKDKFSNLIQQWIEAMVDLEAYEVAGELHDFYKRNYEKNK